MFDIGTKLKELLDSPEVKRLSELNADAVRLAVKAKLGERLLKAMREDFDKHLSDRGKQLLETPGMEEFVNVLLANANALHLSKEDARSELLRFASECMSVAAFTNLFGSGLLTEV